MDLLKNLNNMEEIPTAEEYLKRMLKMGMSSSEIMKGFAKRHVETALKIASEEAKTFDVYNESCGDLECKVTFIKKDSIINSYPLNKIK